MDDLFKDVKCTVLFRIGYGFQQQKELKEEDKVGLDAEIKNIGLEEDLTNGRKYSRLPFFQITHIREKINHEKLHL